MMQQSMIDAARAVVADDRAGEPVAWVRFRSDGGFEGPIMDSDSRMDGSRRTSGVWTPLYTAPVVAPGAVSEWQDAVKALMETALPQEYEGLDAPGHRHRVPGIWDATGKPCNWCAAWIRLRAMLL